MRRRKKSNLRIGGLVRYDVNKHAGEGLVFNARELIGLPSTLCNYANPVVFGYLPKACASHESRYHYGLGDTLMLKNSEQDQWFRLGEEPSISTAIRKDTDILLELNHEILPATQAVDVLRKGTDHYVTLLNWYNVDADDLLNACDNQHGVYKTHFNFLLLRSVFSDKTKRLGTRSLTEQNVQEWYDWYGKKPQESVNIGESVTVKPCFL